MKFSSTTPRAGHYLVIDGDHTGYDYAYMHMRDATLVDQGDHVYTGQPIGFVGDTGRADGCHLHFEIWKAPGWYSGGRLPSTRCRCCRRGTRPYRTLGPSTRLASRYEAISSGCVVTHGVAQVSDCASFTPHTPADRRGARALALAAALFAAT